MADMAQEPVMHLPEVNETHTIHRTWNIADPAINSWKAMVGLPPPPLIVPLHSSSCNCRCERHTLSDPGYTPARDSHLSRRHPPSAPLLQPAI